MSEAKQGTPATAEALPSEAHAHQPTIKEMLGEQSFFDWFRTVQNGLRQPKNSGEYRYALWQVRRLWSPVCGVGLPLFFVFIMMLMPEAKVTEMETIPVTIEAQKANDVLKDEPKAEETEPIEPPPPDDTTITPEMTDVGDASAAMPGLPGASGPAGASAGPSTPFSPQPAAFDSVAMIKSPIKMKGVYASRAPGARGTNFGRGGAGGGGAGGSVVTESAVLRALRYLKKNQQADGSWKAQKVAMTGLVVLAYLAHGETPSESKEFGPNVQKAIEFLLKSQRADGKFNGMDGNEYAHPIATYALCEAYGMTLNPNVKVAAEKALLPILKGQHPTGGWTYKMEPGVDEKTGKYRDDTSYMGWCAQALKAAKMADVYSDHAAIEKAIKLAVRGFKKNANPNGGFGYTEPGQGGLTSVGTLCMQLLGGSNESEVKKSQDLMDNWTPSFSQFEPVKEELARLTPSDLVKLDKAGKPEIDKDGKPIKLDPMVVAKTRLAPKVDQDEKMFFTASPQYYFYYATQCKFHSGGKRWANWNKAMVACYVKNQKVVSKSDSGYVDADGKPQDIGWWENSDSHTDRPIMDTCLAALQLMVYYRYLPTYQTAKAVTDEYSSLTGGTETKGDIQVDIGNL